MHQHGDLRQLHELSVLLRDLRMERDGHLRRKWRNLRVLHAIQMCSAWRHMPDQHNGHMRDGRELRVLLAERESGVLLHHDWSKLRLLQWPVHRRRLHLASGAATNRAAHAVPGQ